MSVLAAPLRVSSLHESIIEIMDDIGDLALLPQLLARQVFAGNGRLHGTGLVIIDSLHGLGNFPSDKRFYSAIYEYLRAASASDIMTIALAHMNKARELSGPKALEHAIDSYEVECWMVTQPPTGGEMPDNGYLSPPLAA